MSHFTKLSLKIKDRRAIDIAVRKMGWRLERMEKYYNPYTSREFVGSAEVFKDGYGKVKMVVNSLTGEITVDPYYMGRQYEQFCVEYDKAVIETSAMDAGGWISNQFMDKNEYVIEVTFP